MKKILVIFLVLCVAAILILPSAALGSASAGLIKPYISVHIVDDPDDNFEYFDIQYSLNNSAWRVVDTFDINELDDSGNFLFLVPDSVLNLVENGANVRYRCSACSANGCVYSSAVTVISTLPDQLYITDLRLSGDSLVWDTNIYVFETSSNSYGVQVKHNGITTVYNTIERYFDISFLYNSLGVLDGDYEFRISAYVRGQMYYSNWFSYSGVPEYTMTVDTSLIYPSDSDMSSPAALLYSGVTRTPVYRYVFSGLVYVLPLCGLVFLINKVH